MRDSIPLPAQLAVAGLRGGEGTEVLWGVGVPGGMQKCGGDFIQGCLNPPSDLLPICKAGVWGWLQGAKIPSPSDFGLGDTAVARSWGVPGPAGGSPSLIPPLRGHPGAQTSHLLPHPLLQCITYCSGDLSWKVRRSQCPVKMQRENHSPWLAGEVKLQLCLVLAWPEAAVAQQGWARVGDG